MGARCVCGGDEWWQRWGVMVVGGGGSAPVCERPHVSGGLRGNVAYTLYYHEPKAPGVCVWCGHAAGGVVGIWVAGAGTHVVLCWGNKDCIRTPPSQPELQRLQLCI